MKLSKKDNPCGRDSCIFSISTSGQCSSRRKTMPNAEVSKLNKDSANKTLVTKKKTKKGREVESAFEIRKSLIIKIKVSYMTIPY